MTRSYTIAPPLSAHKFAAAKIPVLVKVVADALAVNMTRLPQEFRPPTVADLLLDRRFYVQFENDTCPLNTRHSAWRYSIE
jgi:hypothetical protein